MVDLVIRADSAEGIFSPSGSGGLDADWLARSTASGVVYANSLSTEAEVEEGAVAGTNGLRCFHDTSQKVLSGGSLRFDLRAGEGSADISGNWSIEDSPWVHGFGQNSTMYIQVRVRISETMFTNYRDHWDGQGDFKMFIVFQDGGSTCAQLEFTTIGPHYELFYTACGARSGRTELDSPDHNGSAPHTYRQGWDLTSGPSWVNEPNALSQLEYPYNTNIRTIPADQWVTLYCKVAIGDWGADNSTVEIWQQYPGESILRKCNAVRNYRFNHNGNPAQTFGNIMLTPYMTGLSTTAPVNAYMWFSELIISSEPIAIPAPAPA